MHPHRALMDYAYQGPTSMDLLRRWLYEVSSETPDASNHQSHEIQLCLHHSHMVDRAIHYLQHGKSIYHIHIGLQIEYLMYVANI